MEGTEWADCSNPSTHNWPGMWLWLLAWNSLTMSNFHSDTLKAYRWFPILRRWRVKYLRHSPTPTPKKELGCLYWEKNCIIRDFRSRKWHFFLYEILVAHKTQNDLMSKSSCFKLKQSLCRFWISNTHILRQKSLVKYNFVFFHKPSHSFKIASLGWMELLFD